MQLYNVLFSRKIHCTTSKKLTRPIIEFSLKSKFLPNITDILLIFFSHHFGRLGAWHDITSSAGSQINNKFSDNDSMAEEFYKKYKNTYVTNNFRLRILGNKKKFQIEWRQMVAPSLSSRNNFLSITAKNYIKVKVSKISLFCSICLISLLRTEYFVQHCSCFIVPGKNL